MTEILVNCLQSNSLSHKPENNHSDPEQVKLVLHNANGSKTLKTVAVCICMYMIIKQIIIIFTNYTPGPNNTVQNNKCDQITFKIALNFQK